MLHVDHSRHAQSPGSSLPGTRVAAHGKRAAPLLARFLLTAQGAGASGLFSQPRVRHGACKRENQLKWESLKKRRRDGRLMLLYKGLKGEASIPTDGITRPAPSVRRCRNHHYRAFQAPLLILIFISFHTAIRLRGHSGQGC